MLSAVELNQSRGAVCKVNMEALESVEKGDEVKETRWTCTADRPVRMPLQVREIMRLGSGRSTIENNVFRTFKDIGGCHLEHDYGYGKRQLCALMMLVALLFDRICDRK